MDAAITPLELKQRLEAFPPPTLDRRAPATGVRRRIPDVIPGAVRRLPEAVDAWARALEPWRPVVVYCVRGHEVEPGRRGGAARARASTRATSKAASSGGAPTGCATQPFAAPTRWVTRERPKIDRIACPWLVRRFIDPAAEFLYVPNAEVRAFAAANGADAPTTFRTSRTRTSAPSAASTRSSGCTSSTTRRSTRSRRSCAAPTPARSQLAPQAPGLLAAVARPVGDVRRRPRDAEVGDARLRLALRVVPRGADARRTAGIRRSCASRRPRDGGAADATRRRARTPTRAEAFRYWLKLGFISFGGPAGQIAIMHHELVERRRWISERRFLHALNYCMVLPGPEAQQLATYIGWLMHRTWGGIVAGGAVRAAVARSS